MPRFAMTNIKHYNHPKILYILNSYIVYTAAVNYLAVGCFFTLNFGNHLNFK